MVHVGYAIFIVSSSLATIHHPVSGKPKLAYKTSRLFDSFDIRFVWVLLVSFSLKRVVDHNRDLLCLSNRLFQCLIEDIHPSVIAQSFLERHRTVCAIELILYPAFGLIYGSVPENNFAAAFRTDQYITPNRKVDCSRAHCSFVLGLIHPSKLFLHFAQYSLCLGTEDLRFNRCVEVMSDEGCCGGEII